jgi:predicted O-linked N-acetylglucosamine transferase (SPINDLY family)
LASPAARATDLIGQALAHHRAGRLAQAEPLYRQALMLDPRNSDAIHLLGVIAAQVGRPMVAIELIGRAIRLDPAVADYHNSLGNALKDAERFAESAESYRRALTLSPTAQTHNNLGAVLRDLGRLAESMASCQQALALEPGFVDAWSNLGATLRAQGRLDEAVAAGQRALTLDPLYGDGFVNLGNAFWDLGRLDEAVGSYRRALELRPDHAVVWSNLGNALKDQGQLDQAVESYQRAVALKPEYVGGYSNLGSALMAQTRVAEAVASYRRALALRPDYVDARDNLLLSLLYLPDLAPAELLAEHQIWDVVHGRPLASQIRPHANSREPERRLRIGYVSPDFRQHAIAYAFLPLLANHDRSQFEVLLYSSTRQRDGMTERLRGLADGWREIAGLTDELVSEQIRADGIDLLVDLACHTAGNRLGVFARKPAPLQVTHSGMTSGLSAIDYVLADQYLAPDLPPEALAERPLRLVGCYTCYTPPAEAPAVGPLPALATGQVTFGSFNNLSKLNPSVAALWGRILREVPGSRLLLKGSQAVDAATHERVRALFSAQGLPAERVVFLPKTLGLAEHLGRYGLIDIGLDPFPFNGFTTTCEALWMGLPVVTLAGRLFADRAGVTFLTAAGLPELVAADGEAYVRIAAQLAADLPALAILRAGLRERVAGSTLCDGPGYARRVEAAFRAAWREWCGGRVGCRPAPERVISAQR